MSEFRPEVSYDKFKTNNIKCRLCEAPLTEKNYGENIDDHVGYAPSNSFYLAKWGFFCNPCSVQVIEAEEQEYKKNTSNLSKAIN